ncbi:expressed unknown protein [Seminavis robusta]|uniref:Uncharacterized protein n=1 Tax=Seminavis robusta TaxID=568900 RepID=A0A9N8EWZ9_9STRA|nr:expressed unknown protein [Seminavis robusta]|eukprot:Sro1852_g301710.1 n/a (389) ;mRNA; f:5678-7040
MDQGRQKSKIPWSRSLLVVIQHQKTKHITIALIQTRPDADHETKTAEEEAGKPGKLGSTLNHQKQENEERQQEQKEEEQQKNENEAQSIFAHAKQSIAYPAAKTKKNQAVVITARKVATESAMLAAEKRKIAYPKQCTRVGQTEVRPAGATNEQQLVHNKTQTMANTAKAAETSALLAHEKGHIVYPRSGPSEKKRATKNQGHRPGIAVPVQGHTATTEGGNSPSAGDTIEQQQHHLLSTVEINRIGLNDMNAVRVHTVQNDVHLPRMERSIANRRPQLQPGAHPSGGNFQAVEENLETAVMHIELATTQPPTFNPVDSYSNLAVANLVEDETTSQDPPHAQDCNLENENRGRGERMKQFKIKVILGVIVLLAILIILVAILIPRSQG